MEKIQARFQAASAEYQKLQSDLSVIVDSRQKLEAQLQENETVKKVTAASICELLETGNAEGFLRSSLS